MNTSDSSSIAGKNIHNSWILYDIAVFTVFYLIFFYSYKCILWSDLQCHIEIINGQLKNGEHFSIYMALPRYCLQALSTITSYFKGQLGDETGCVVIMLSLAAYLKYYFTRRMIHYFISGCSELNCRIFAFSLAFVAPIALGVSENNVHRWNGTLATSCWHNITIIFCAAFSLALFWYTVRWFRDGYKNQDILLLCMYLILSILSKPSFMFAFLPAYCLVMLLYLPAERSRRLLACIPVVLILAFYLIMSKQMEVFKVIIYGTETNAYGGGIYWAPFELFLYHLKNFRTILTVHFCSIAFPILTGLYMGIAYLKKRGPVNIVFTMTLLQSVFGIMTGYLFNMGEGFNRFSSNMTWQIIVCNYILFTMCVIAILRERVSKWCTILLTVYGMHFLSGVLFVLEIFRTKAGWVDPIIGWWNSP